MTHEQEVGELTERLRRKSETLAAALGRDVIAEEEAAHRAALRFREEEARNKPSLRTACCWSSLPLHTRTLAFSLAPSHCTQALLSAPSADGVLCGP